MKRLKIALLTVQKSAEEYENRGVNFARWVAKSEKGEGAEMGWAKFKVERGKKRTKHGGTEFTEEGKRDGEGLAAIPSRLPSSLWVNRLGKQGKHEG